MILPGTGRGTGRRLVEGRSSRALNNNHLNRPVQLIENVTSRNSQHLVSECFQIGLTQRVDRRAATHIVCGSVNFDQQP